MKITQSQLHEILHAHKRKGDKIPVMAFVGKGRSKRPTFSYCDADLLDGAALGILEPDALQVRTAEAIAKHFEIDASSLVCWFPIDSSIQEAYAFIPPVRP